MSQPRTLEEVKKDIRERVGRRAPFLHADKAEAEEAKPGQPHGTISAPVGRKKQPQQKNLAMLRKPKTAF
jgi:hypothetical protein